SRKIVGTGNENVLYTAVFQAIQYGCPELGTLVFADPHPQNIFPAVQIDANGNVNGLLHDLALAADVVVNGVQEHHRIDGLQRPLLPLFGNGKDLVCDPAYGAVRYRNPIDVLDMSLNIAGGHALGVHGQDLLLNVLADAGLALFQHLRLKLPFPVPGNRDLHVSKACPERLAAMTIPAVVCSLVLVVISAVAQILIQLCLQTVLHEFGNGLLEQVLDVIHAADVCHLQKFSDLLSTGVFFRGAVLSGHMLILLYDASILHLSGSLHKLWDSLVAYSLPHTPDRPKYCCPSFFQTSAKEGLPHRSRSGYRQSAIGKQVSPPD